jgi:hypothetical protein
LGGSNGDIVIQKMISSPGRFANALSEGLTGIRFDMPVRFIYKLGFEIGLS